MGWRTRLRARGRTVEALVLVTAGGAAQRWIPMPRWSALLGDTAEVPDEWRGRTITALPQRAASPVERQVAGSVRRAAGLLPWPVSCLAEATAGQVMLRRRGEPGVVVIGLRRPESPGGWDAHAWLLGEAGALTGGPAARGFTATTVFAPAGRRVPELPGAHPPAGPQKADPTAPVAADR